MDFKPGDQVQIKSGGPAMTVESVEDEEVYCVWSDNIKGKQEIRRDKFVAVVLDRCEPSSYSVR